MSSLPASGANAAQIEFWNGRAAAGWVDNQVQMDRLLAPLSDAALARAALQAGERVLDVGCGCGATSLAAARAGAHVVGVDISAPMLEAAGARASAEALSVSFVLADASTHRFDAPFDVLFSRFGVMFFADPTEAFANLRQTLAHSGRIAFVCWQAARDNAWMAVPGAALAPFLAPSPATDPRAPGPFAFADADYLRGVLQGAGYRKIAIDSLAADLQLGSSVEEAMRFLTENVGPLSRPIAELAADVRTKALDVVRTAMATHARDGAVRLGARCWLVTARAN